MNIPGTVETIEYDPNRSSRIALVKYADGERRYMLAVVGLKVGQTVEAGEAVDIRPGNALPMAKIPLGTAVHNVELKIGRGGQMLRSAGTLAQRPLHRIHRRTSLLHPARTADCHNQLSSETRR